MNARVCIVFFLGIGFIGGMLGYLILHRNGALTKSHESQISLYVASTPMQAEVVRSKEDMQKGLADRDSLCRDCAMLFMFSGQGRRSFWMKGMRFPLDIIWISHGTIVHVEKNISSNDARIFFPEELTDIVLEVNAGMSDVHNWKIGDKILFQHALK